MQSLLRRPISIDVTPGAHHMLSMRTVSEHGIAVAPVSSLPPTFPIMRSPARRGADLFTRQHTCSIRFHRVATYSASLMPLRGKKNQKPPNREAVPPSKSSISRIASVRLVRLGKLYPNSEGNPRPVPGVERQYRRIFAAVRVHVPAPQGVCTRCKKTGRNRRGCVPRQA